MLAISQEEAEELDFGVLKKVETAHTVNLCQQCFSELILQQGKPRLYSWQWRGSREKDGTL